MTATALPEFVISTDPQVLADYGRRKPGWEEFCAYVSTFAEDLGLTLDDVVAERGLLSRISVTGLRKPPAPGHGRWTSKPPHKPFKNNIAWQERMKALHWMPPRLPGLPEAVHQVTEELSIWMVNPSARAVTDGTSVAVNIGAGMHPLDARQTLGPQWRECSMAEYARVKETA